MKSRFRKQARQFYEALKRRGQTWTRKQKDIDNWARAFEQLEARTGKRKRIERVLKWYCQFGCGAIFVPIACSGETFSAKFADICSAYRNHKNDTLIYFDEVLKYRIPRTKGSRIQREYQLATKKVEQQIQYVDDLVHKRRKLPKPKAMRIDASESLTKAERQKLKGLLIVNRDLLWDLLMSRPGMLDSLGAHLHRNGVFKKLRRFGKRRRVEQCPF